MSSAHTKQWVVMKKTYGIATCEGAYTDIIELDADTIEGSREEAAKLMDREIRPSSLVELDGRGPFYSSDGELISYTHAPSRTIEDHIEANYKRLMPAAWPRKKEAYDDLRRFEAGAAFVLDRSTEGSRGPEVEQTYLCDVDFRKLDEQGLVRGGANGVRIYRDGSCWVYNNAEDEVWRDLDEWMMSWWEPAAATRILGGG